MIFYFSATGNSAWVAHRLASLTDDTAYDITTLHTLPNLQTTKQIGFVFPVYAWGAPEIMATFAKKLPKGNTFAFGVCTCGEDAGLTMKQFAKLYPLDSSYSLIMPNNYIIGSDTDSKEVISSKLTLARKELAQIAQEIQQQKRTYRVHEGSLAGIKSHLANFGFNRFARSTKPFFVTEACNGCGLCEKNCPASAISMKNSKPLWNVQCYQCMGCINQCPQQAIQYGKSTIGRHRYTIQPYLPKEEQF